MKAERVAALKNVITVKRDAGKAINMVKATS
jgi:hypothetical protein